MKLRHSLVHTGLATVAAATAAGMLGAAPADADPQTEETLAIDCDRVGTLDVVVFSNGSPSPGLVVGSNQVALPYQLQLEGTFTPVDGEPQSFTESFARPAPRNGRLDHCTFHQEDSDELGSFVVDGDIWISYTPAR